MWLIPLFEKDDRINKLTKQDGRLILQTVPDFSPAELNKMAVSNDVYLDHLVCKSKSLEDEFLEITKEHS